MARAITPLRLGLVGCGRVVEECHLPALQTLADVEVVALVDSDGDRLNTVADRLGVRQRHTDYRVMLKETSVDVVAVCTPPQAHAEIGLAVLEAGMHLFMEKPLALCLDDADRLVDRAAASAAKALVGFNFRWHRLLRQARRVIDDGSLGPLGTMHSEFTSRNGFVTPRSSWRLRHDFGGSVLLDLGVHHFDLWRFLMQSDVEEVFASHRSVDPGVECATVSAKMDNGVLVTATFSHGLSDTNELEICGQKARLRLSCYRSDGLRVCENSAPQSTVGKWFGAVTRVVRKAARLGHGGDVLGSYRAQWQHFIDVIRNDMPVQCTLADGRRALQVALAAVESAARGEPVRVAQATRAIAPIPSALRLSRSAG